jgi:type I restriction enzyme M protein
LRDPKILANEHLARFDCVIANPPFSLKNWGAEAWKTDRYGRNLWGTPPETIGDYAWLQHMVSSMRSINGRMAVVLPQGVLFRGNEEGRIREELVKSDYVEAVITLGDKLFYGTGLSPCILIIRDQKPLLHRGKVLMVDGSKILTPQRAQNILSDDDVDELYRLYTAYDEEEDKSIVVDIETIAGKDYDLSPNKYVKYHKEEVKPYAEVLTEFKSAYQQMIDAEKKFRDILNREAV